jgi:hypothetical protein
MMTHPDMIARQAKDRLDRLTRQAQRDRSSAPSNAEPTNARPVRTSLAALLPRPIRP